MNDDIFNMFYPLAREPQEILARAVQTSIEKLADILVGAAKEHGSICSVVSKGCVLVWLFRRPNAS